MNSRTKFLLPQILLAPNFEIPGVHYLPHDTLHVAAALGYTHEIQMMLAQNPDLANKPHSLEKTIPLCWALQSQQTQAVALLIDHSQQPRVAPLAHHSPLHYLNSTWAKANPQLTEKLLANTLNALDYVYTFALDSLSSVEISTLLQNYLLMVKHGNQKFLTLIAMNIKITTCLQKLYLSADEDGLKAFYILASWITLSVCKPMFNMVSTEDRELILNVIKNINLTDANFYVRFKNAVQTFAPAYNQLTLAHTSAVGIASSYLYNPSRQDSSIKQELALVLFDAADHEAYPDLAESLYESAAQAQGCSLEHIDSLKRLADSVNNSNAHLCSSALLALQDETEVNGFKAAIVLKTVIKAATDRKMDHKQATNRRLIIGGIEKALVLVRGLGYKNTSLGDLFEAAGDAYRTNFLLRLGNVYPSEPLQNLYSTAASLQVTQASLSSSRSKLSAIVFTEAAAIASAALPSIAGLFSRLRIGEEARARAASVNSANRNARAPKP